MAKLIKLEGLPASGKTTIAREMVEQDGNTGRVNRDDLRAMLFNGKWSHYREKIVIEVEKAIAQILLDNKQNVVVDDTNLGPKDIWQSFQPTVKRLDTSLEACIFRDTHSRKTKENGRVGRAIIERMALFNGMDMGWLGLPIVIVDIDGTLADLNHRLHNIANPGQKDYRAFHAQVHLDKPIQGVIDWVHAIRMSEEFEIVIVSGRGDECAIATEDWLLRNEVIYDHLFMRRGGDYRDDAIIKQEVLDAIKTSYRNQIIEEPKFAFVIDDRPRVIKMWKDNGLKVYPVNQEQWVGRE